MPVADVASLEGTGTYTLSSAEHSFAKKNSGEGRSGLHEAVCAMIGVIASPPTAGLAASGEMPSPSAPGCFFSEELRRAKTAVPVYLMNLPLSLSAQVANNAWMDEMSAVDREVRPASAISQFLELYRHISGQAIVYLLPSRPGLQDQPYVANLAAVLPHCHEDTVLISRFRASARARESAVGTEFFRLMEFSVHEMPEAVGGSEAFFEGEADLKHVHGNVYVGGYGLRTSLNALEWTAERFGMRIIPYRITDPYLYHLDCCVLRLTNDAMLVCTSLAEPGFLRELEKHCQIIDVTLDEARAGITNSLVLADQILCDTDIGLLDEGNRQYAVERAKIRRLEEICGRLGRSLHTFCLSEFYKSGALLSCLVLPVRHASADSL
ncbi:arginine deiminase-related protein [Mesorhizobium sp. YM1C-6-2]|uniref:dimethylarginine dimethylaminohydrolase family protein n=1 Tax=Mesorhizobium sp. YM1C-6-2 TaxID=1827501 RepID=UPI0011C37F9F|nr:arginine deiminase-related protein [Mesorhizobium sp. YM1C-6-2]